MIGHRWITWAIVLTSATAAAQPKTPTNAPTKAATAPKLPAVRDVAKLTFVWQEGGPSRGLCKAFERRVVIDLRTKRYTREACIVDDATDTAKIERDRGRVAMFDQVIERYGVLTTANSDGGCAKDAGPISLTITKKNGTSLRFYASPLACPRRTGFVMPNLVEEIGAFETYLDAVN